MKGPFTSPRFFFKFKACFSLLISTPKYQLAPNLANKPPTWPVNWIYLLALFENLSLSKILFNLFIILKYTIDNKIYRTI